VNAPSSRLLRSAALLVTLASAGCVGHTHVVGLGATGTGEVSERQYYLMFGLVPINDVDSQRFAPDVTSYTVETRFGIVDLLLAPVLLPFTVTSRSVVVRT
jgi:hypothetical protein